MGANHMAEQQRGWSPGQAMLPPDPDGLNRALDRAAAEHLREVAPHLAPSATAPPQPEPAQPRWRKRPVVVDAVQVTAEWFDGDHPNPLHPAGIEIHPVLRCVFVPTLEGTMRGNEGDWIITGVKGERYPCKPDVFAATYEPVTETAPAPESGEMSREAYRRTLSILVNEAHERGAGCVAVAVEATCGELVRHDAALRASRDEERTRGDMYADLHAKECQDGAQRLASVYRERDEAREQRDAAQGLLSEALCNLGTARGDLATERAARLRAEAERDGALTEANDLRLRVERLVEGAAKLTERAEEAEEELRLADFRVKSAESRSDDFAARLAAAEAEVKRLRGDLAAERRLTLSYDDPSLDGTDGAHPAWWRGSDAGVAGAVRIVNEALDGPLPLAGCVGGADLEAVRQRVAALRASVARLVEAGDEARDILNAILDNQYTYRERVDAVDRWVARWAAAKAGRALDAPAGSEAKR